MQKETCSLLSFSVSAFTPACCAYHGCTNMCMSVGYPTVCTVAFASFICRPFSKHHSVLMADDSVLCEAADHKVIMILSYLIESSPIHTRNMYIIA